MIAWRRVCPSIVLRAGGRGRRPPCRATAATTTAARAAGWSCGTPDPRWPSAPRTLSTSSSSARAPAATPRPFGCPARPQGRPRRRGQARRTCLHRGCIPTKALLESAAFTERVRHAKDFGLNLAGDRRSTTSRWPPGATRSSTGCGRACRRSSARTRSPGSRVAAGSRAARRSGSARPATTARRRGRRARARGQRRDPRHGLAGQEPAGHRARRQADRHLGRRPEADTLPEGHRRRRRRARSASSSPRCTTTWARR